jgi:hypothetical protein
MSRNEPPPALDDPPRVLDAVSPLHDGITKMPSKESITPIAVFAMESRSFKPGELRAPVDEVTPASILGAGDVSLSQ